MVDFISKQVQKKQANIKAEIENVLENSPHK